MNNFYTKKNEITKKEPALLVKIEQEQINEISNYVMEKIKDNNKEKYKINMFTNLLKTYIASLFTIIAIIPLIAIWEIKKNILNSYNTFGNSILIFSFSLILLYCSYEIYTEKDREYILSLTSLIIAIIALIIVIFK